MTRIAVGGFLHETNTFAPTKATYDDFVHGGGWPSMAHGAEILKVMRKINVGLAGFVEAAEANGWEMVPTVSCGASPSAHVTGDAFERIVKEMIDGIAAAGTLDAVYLDLHGAMVTEHFDDGEGEILARVRKVIGKELPLVVSLDLHANVTPEMVEHADALIAYRTYPHIDMADTGRACAKHLALMLKTKQRFAKAFRQVPFLIPISWQCTNDQPAKGIYQKLAALENDAVPTLSFAPGFPAADFRDCGPSVFAYARTQADADAAADRLVALIEGHEDDFDGRIYSPDDGVRHAMELARTASKPIIIADTQDNPGAGGDSDTTGMLRALVRNNAIRAAHGVIYDPQSAKAAHAAGEGATVTLALGGKSGIPGDAPYKETLRRRKTVGRKIRGGGSLLWRPRHGHGAVGSPAHRRRPRGREFAQGATRGSIDVSFCRDRADRASDPGQQELGAFPRRFRTDRRTTADLRRPRRDAGGYRVPALDQAAPGHSHQAERPCLRASNAITFHVLCNRIKRHAKYRPYRRLRRRTHRHSP